jgi:lipoprotein-anchoring transpeptidase ErfK/SrfK
MSYTSTIEMLGERFHMSETYLKELNPGANFNRTGTVIKVANTGSNVTRQVSRIIADKGREQVRAYDGAGRLVVAYPATIGSSDTPSPVGTHTVERIALNRNIPTIQKSTSSRARTTRSCAFRQVPTVRLARSGLPCRSRPTVYTARRIRQRSARRIAMAASA